MATGYVLVRKGTSTLLPVYSRSTLADSHCRENRAFQFTVSQYYFQSESQDQLNLHILTVHREVLGVFHCYDCVFGGHVCDSEVDISLQLSLYFFVPYVSPPCVSKLFHTVRGAWCVARGSHSVNVLCFIASPSLQKKQTWCWSNSPPSLISFFIEIDCHYVA